MTKVTDWINASAALIGACAAISIPVVLHISQQDSEQKGRKVGIAQILSDNYEATCEKRLDTSELLNSWFELSESDIVGVLNYLCPRDEECSKNTEILDQVKNLQTQILLNEEDAPIRTPQELDNSLITTLQKLDKIDIHFLKSETTLQQEAETIKENLIKAGLGNDTVTIRIRPLSQEWFDRTGGLSDNQIRYEREKEVQVAVALQQLLDQVYDKRTFRLQTIRGSTPGSISIFLK